MWFISLREYGISAFMHYSGWFWYFFLPICLLYTFFSNQDKKLKQPNKANLAKKDNKILRTNPFFKIIFILLVITWSWNFVWFGAYLPYCETNNLGGDYGCLAFRFDLLFSSGFAILFSFLSNLYFLISKKNSFVLAKIYLVIFALFFNYFFNINANDTTNQSYPVILIISLLMVGFIDILSYFYYIINNIKGKVLVKNSMLSLKFWLPMMVVITMSIFVLIPGYIWYSSQRPLSSHYLIFTTDSTINSKEEYQNKIEQIRNSHLPFTDIGDGEYAVDTDNNGTITQEESLAYTKKREYKNKR
jgi:hypothetical protein